MATSLQESISSITDFLRSEARTDTVVGQSFQLGGFSCVPVIRVGMGFGFGGGEGQDQKQGHGEGSGAGAGFGIDPIGFLVTQGDQIQFVPTRPTRGLSTVFEKMPEVLEKILTKKEPSESVPA